MERYYVAYVIRAIFYTPYSPTPRLSTLPPLFQEYYIILILKSNQEERVMGALVEI